MDKSQHQQKSFEKEDDMLIEIHPMIYEALKDGVISF